MENKYIRVIEKLSLEEEIVDLIHDFVLNNDALIKQLEKDGCFDCVDPTLEYASFLSDSFSDVIPYKKANMYMPESSSDPDLAYVFAEALENVHGWYTPDGYNYYRDKELFDECLEQGVFA